MDKVLMQKTAHRSSEIRDRLENDIEFRQTSERMIAEILDTPTDAGDGSAKSHAIWISKELLKPHINNLRISIIDSYRAGNLHNYLIWHNGYRRLIEISIDSVSSDCVSERIASFAQRRQRMENDFEEPSINDEPEIHCDHCGREILPDESECQCQYEPEDDPDLRPREMDKEVT